MGIGGSVDAGSQSDRVLRAVLTPVAGLGAEVEVFSGLDLDLPPYHSGAVVPAAAARLHRRGPPRRCAGDQLARATTAPCPAWSRTPWTTWRSCAATTGPTWTGGRSALVAVARGWQAAVSHPGHPAAGRARAARLADPAGAGDQQHRHHASTKPAAPTTPPPRRRSVRTHGRAGGRLRRRWRWQPRIGPRRRPTMSVRSRRPGDILGSGPAPECAPGRRGPTMTAHPTQATEDLRAARDFLLRAPGRLRRRGREVPTGRGRAPSTGASSGSTSSRRSARIGPRW